MELAAIDSDAQPRSVEQFERSALAHPGSSQLWIAYMAFHLQVRLLVERNERNEQFKRNEQFERNKRDERIEIFELDEVMELVA